jgi:serine acetyltransferase
MRIVLTNAGLNPGATTVGEVGVGRGCFVGVGAVVIGDIPANVTKVGVPARVVMHHGG